MRQTFVCNTKITECPFPRAGALGWYDTGLSACKQWSPRARRQTVPDANACAGDAARRGGFMGVPRLGTGTGEHSKARRRLFRQLICFGRRIKSLSVRALILWSILRRSLCPRTGKCPGGALAPRPTRHAISKIECLAEVLKVKSRSRWCWSTTRQPGSSCAANSSSWRPLRAGTSPYTVRILLSQSIHGQSFPHLKYSTF